VQLRALHGKTHWTQSFVDWIPRAHSNKLIHCDTQSGDIVLDHANHRVVADLGLVRLSLEKHSDDQTSCPGAAEYQAPELECGGKQGYDLRVDLYSAGIVFSELPLDAVWTKAQR
jgi:serine/threonine protein kinase